MPKVEFDALLAKLIATPATAKDGIRSLAKRSVGGLRLRGHSTCLIPLTITRFSITSAKRSSASRLLNRNE